MPPSERQLREALTRSTDLGCALALRQEGLEKEFEAAGIVADNVKLDLIRQQMHDLLDHKLDNKASLMSLARALALL